MPAHSSKAAARLLTAVVIALIGSHGPARSATETIGNGSVKVALIVPLSAPGPGGAFGRALRNTAELALAEWDDPDIQLLIEDDGGDVAGAERAAQQALDDGAAMILGPASPGQIRAAAGVVRPRGVPMIAFSDDAAVAAPGVYVLGHRPQNEIDRVVGYAIASSRRVVAALLPETGYGQAVETAFRDAVPRAGGTVAAVERYAAGAGPSTDAILRLSRSPAEAVLVADTSDGLIAAAHALAADPDLRARVQLIGTSVWGRAQVFADPALAGGWFATPDTSLIPPFIGRYRSRFGEYPNPSALLAYDAVALAVSLHRTYGSRAFSAAALTDPSGFLGLLGPFRFRDDGTIERALAVCRVTPSGSAVVSPAPDQF